MIRNRLLSRLPGCAVLAGALAVGCSSASEPGKDGSGGQSPPALRVVSVSPANGATNVATGTPVVVTFSAEVEASSVTTSSFVVEGATGTIAVSGSTSTFTPSSPYANGATLSVRVTGVRDKNGGVLASMFTSSFAVIAQPATADAGADRQVTAGARVALDGSRSTGTSVTYTWTQLAGPSVGALTGVAPTFTAPTEIARLDFELAVSGTGPTDRDTVSLWVLEDSAHAYFVAKTGSDANAGTRAAPFATIGKAISVADADGNGGDVYIAAGAYAETIELKSRVSLYGGFVDGTWRRAVATSRPVIDGGRIAVRGSNVNDLVLEGLFIRAASATGSSESSIALLLHESRRVTVRASRLQALNGANGTKGVDGVDRAKAGNGGAGANAGTCTPPRRGGDGGTSNLGRDGGSGGNGGLAGGFGGNDGQGNNGGSGGNGGGAAGGNGRPGTAGGSAGADGAGGEAGNGVGALSSAGIAVLTAGNGGAGGNGWGGGGGGGGGGGFGCGGGGGGGGAGAQGGGAGLGGTSGGHSVGIALSGTSIASLIDSDVIVGNGGSGGAGGAGGLGGAGGSGGNGGANNLSGGAGGDGGNGSRGGEGGGGGGGAGGWSIAILESSSAVSTRTAVTITRGAPGAGGTGGPRASGNAGAAGANGSTVDLYKLP